jgi:lipopolysaccharide transport system ATP-binding protein
VASGYGEEDPYLQIGDLNDRATKGESDYVRALILILRCRTWRSSVELKNGAGKSTLLKILSE